MTSSVVTPALGADETQFVPSDVSTFPFAPGDVSPVPPCAGTSVPDSVISPVLKLLGVNPVVPALNALTAVVIAPAHVKALPSHFKNLFAVDGAAIGRCIVDNSIS